MTAATVAPSPTRPNGMAALSASQRRVIWIALGIVAVSAIRTIADAPDLTSAGTTGAALRLAIPIGFAGIGGLFAERAGIINIGLEGMMILGTWFGAWGAWQFGPWRGLLLGILGGAIGGLIHAVATVTFNVDQIISGVAVNIIAAGLVRYLSVLAYDTESGGGATQSPRRNSAIPTVTLPGVSDALETLEKRRWFVLSDVAGVSRGLVTNISLATIAAAAFVVFATWLLWKTRFGLRLRSSGENPFAAESLGVRVQRVRYSAVVISGMCAGFGGAYLSVVHSSIYKEGQTAGRGFIGLATMIFGNWMPGGTALGALLFGFSDALQLRSSEDVPALFGVVALASLGLAVYLGRKRRTMAAAAAAAGTVVFGALFFSVDSIPGSITFFTPHVVTLVVLATASQRLRPPAMEGLPYRPGEGH